MYELHNFLRPLLLLMYSFWVPQIITSVIRDTRKPLHPQYILGMTVTRLAIPLYMLLLQHYLGSRCFIPRQVLTT